MHEFSSGYSFNVFNKNGTGYYIEFDYKDGYRPGQTEDMEPFTYKFDEKNNILTITEKDGDYFDRYSYNVLELTSNKLKVIDPDGYVENYTRYNGDLEDIEREFNVTLKVDND